MPRPNARRVPYRLLETQSVHGDPDADSWLIQGDNLEALKARPGELDSDLNTEKTACAIAIDRLDAVRFWVRNLERRPLTSFWLPTATDRFYPDFVLRLNDERLLAVEYKGGDRFSNDDSREKRDIGDVWAAASGERCLFAMVTDARTAGCPVEQQLQRAIAQSSA